MFIFMQKAALPNSHLFFAYSRKTQQMYFYQLLGCHMAKAQLHKSFKQMFTSLDINPLPHILAAV